MTGYVSGGPRVILRLEGLGVLAASALCYARFGSGWVIFFACFLLPDLSMLGYLAGRKIGAIGYNLGHSYLIPMICLVLGFGLRNEAGISAGLIWTAHIGFDRMLGYGLKYFEGFGFTHLGLKGKARLS